MKFFGCHVFMWIKQKRNGKICYNHCTQNILIFWAYLIVVPRHFLCFCFCFYFIYCCFFSFKDLQYSPYSNNILYFRSYLHCPCNAKKNNFLRFSKITLRQHNFVLQSILNCSTKKNVFIRFPTFVYLLSSKGILHFKTYCITKKIFVLRFPMFTLLQHICCILEHINVYYQWKIISRRICRYQRANQNP